MSLKGQTLLKGHALRYEGDLCFDANGVLRASWGPGRRAKCECGALSPPEMRSIYAVRRWHRVHKDALR